MFDLTGRRALVTGAGQGVGEGIARGLAQAGGVGAINDRPADRARALGGRRGHRGGDHEQGAREGGDRDPHAHGAHV